MDADLNAQDIGNIVGRLLVYIILIGGAIYLFVKSRKNKK